METAQNDQSENPANDFVKQEPDWKIGSLYREAWKIVKKYKVLWIFGMAVAAEGFSGSGSSRFSENFNTYQKYFQNIQNTSNNDLSMVLGASTDALSEHIAGIFGSIPPGMFLLLILEFLLIIGISIILSVIYNCWAEGSLLFGVQEAIANKNISISSASEKSFSVLIKIIQVRIIPNLLILLAFILSLIILPFLSIFFGPLILLTAIIWFAFLAVVFLMINLSQIWAVRKIVTGQITAKQALRDGYEIAKKKFLPMILLGILNILLLFIIVMIIFIPAIGLFFGGFFMLFTGISGTAFDIIQVGFYLVVSAVILYGIGQIAISVASGIIKAFTTIVWSLAYQKIKGKYDK